MSLNTTKTKSMVITTWQKRRRLTTSLLNISVNGQSIDQVDQAKMLGVIIDNSFTWEHHVEMISSVISSRLSLLRRIKPFLTSDASLRFYNSCIHNYFTYCSAVWGNCSLQLLLRLLRLQKRAARILLDADYSQRSVSLFSKLHWMPIFHLIKTKVLMLLFNVLLNPVAPVCLKNLFTFISDLRGDSTRRTRASLYDLRVPYPRSESGKRTLAYTTSKLFNVLPSDFKQNLSSCYSSILSAESRSSTLSSFKVRLRKMLLSKLATVDHLEDLLCSKCRYALNCTCYS